LGLWERQRRSHKPKLCNILKGHFAEFSVQFEGMFSAQNTSENGLETISWWVDSDGNFAKA
jgi:hypothetical protein